MTAGYTNISLEIKFKKANKKKNNFALENLNTNIASHRTINSYAMFGVCFVNPLWD